MGPGADIGGPPDRFGRYRVVRQLGAGGMGAVYLAHDETLGREVAIKALHDDAPLDEKSKQRFMNEARAVASLGHPHIVSVYDLGVEGDTPYIVMELMRGRSLAQLLAERGRLSLGEVCTLGIQMAHALAHAHAAGIVHRDVKPANILQNEAGTWKLADFGVARMPDSSLTTAGMFVGTPAYAAPESLTAGTFEPPCDVFSLGAVLYECLTGSWIQKGKKDVLRAALAYQMASIDPPSRHVPGVSPALDAALLRAVAAGPGARPTAVELAEALAAGGVAAAASPPPVVAPPVPGEVPPTVSVESTVQPTAGFGGRWFWWAIVLMLAAAAALLIWSRNKEPLAAERPAPAVEKSEPPPPAPAAIDASEPDPDEPPWPDLSDRRFDEWQLERWVRARQAFEAGDLQVAVEEVQELLYDNPNDPAAREWLRWVEGYAFERERLGPYRLPE